MFAFGLTGFKTRIQETYPELYSNHYQGDIFFFDENEAKNAVRGEIFRWPNGTIPYVIGSNFSKSSNSVPIIRKSSTN